MLRFITGSWVGYELEFLTMVVSQITDDDLKGFSRNPGRVHLTWHNPSSPWRLMDYRDFLEYRLPNP